MFNCLLHGVVRTPRQHNKRTKVCKIMAFMAVIMGLGLLFSHTFGV